MMIIIYIFIFIAFVSVNSVNADLFELPIVHFNDFHSRFEQTNWNGGSCTEALVADKKCVGGFARMYTKITELMKKSNSILLCAGDNFQGTLFYTVFKWKVVVDFFNMLPFDAVVLGNHEFDDKIDGLLPYIKNLKHNIIAANIDDSEEPRFQGKVKESVVVERGGRKIGIIGYLVKTTNEISYTEKLRFFDEVETVNRVASKLKKSGVDIIIGLSHSGISVDLDVAKNCPDVDVVVGGHTHTLLYTGTPPGGDKAEDVYPIVVTQESGRKVLVVQSGSYTKYIGSITVKFDEAGEVVEGNGNSILLDHTIVEDPNILKTMMEKYKPEVDALSKKVIGTTKVFLENTICRRGECSLGNLITDAMVFEQVNRSKIGELWTYASIAAANAGGIRTTINEVSLAGVITYGDLAMVLPFQDSYDVVEIQRKHILEMLEFSVSKSNKVKDDVFDAKPFLQWSGLRANFDLNHPIGSRVLANVTVMCNECRVPEYEPLDTEKIYRVVLTAFLIGGGDGYSVIRDNIMNRMPGREQTDILRSFLKHKGPVIHGLEGRLKIIQKDTSSNALAITPTCILSMSTFLICMFYMWS